MEVQREISIGFILNGNNGNIWYPKKVTKVTGYNSACHWSLLTKFGYIIIWHLNMVY